MYLPLELLGLLVSCLLFASLALVMWKRIHQRALPEPVEPEKTYVPVTTPSFQVRPTEQPLPIDVPEWMLGPLGPLLRDPSIAEIMVNRHDQIFVERSGQLLYTGMKFESEKLLIEVIRRISTSARRRIDDSSPMVDARLADGSRLNAILPPLATTGPSLTIRKFSKNLLNLKDLVSCESLSPEMAEFLYAAVRARRSVLVSGGTSSGKTTLLNVLLSMISEDERIVTIEDAAELQVAQPNLVSLETRPPNLEGTGRITIRQLLVNALRMRPDRIIVGECRGPEALDMLQAMNTGHEGSLTTLHANSPNDAIARLEMLVFMAGVDMPASVVRKQIAAALDLIIQTKRVQDGSRKIVKITQVSGFRDNDIQLNDLYVFQGGQFTRTGTWQKQK